MVETYPYYDIVMRRNSDGLVKTIRENSPWIDEDDLTLFYWEDGNGGCDCNRQIMFDDPTENRIDIECGTREYTILKYVFPDGSERIADEQII